jgi:hypothetical protein
MVSASLDPQQPAVVSDRLEIRPQKPIVILTSFAFGTLAVVTAAACLVTGGTAVALACVGVGAIGLYAVLGGHLWADAERVGSTRLFEWWGSCRRDELAYLRIRSFPVSGPGCSFVRKDGRVAFTTPAFVFGAAQLTLLATYLGVPLYGKNSR